MLTAHCSPSCVPGVLCVLCHLHIIPCHLRFRELRERCPRSHNRHGAWWLRDWHLVLPSGLFFAVHPCVCRCLQLPFGQLLHTCSPRRHGLSHQRRQGMCLCHPRDTEMECLPGAGLSRSHQLAHLQHRGCPACPGLPLGCFPAPQRLLLPSAWMSHSLNTCSPAVSTARQKLFY